MQQVHEISGGITNILLKLSPSPETSLQPVMLRVFGDNTDLVIDREQEKRLLPKLNIAGFGASVSTSDASFHFCNGYCLCRGRNRVTAGVLVCGSGFLKRANIHNSAKELKVLSTEATLQFDPEPEPVN